MKTNRFLVAFVFVSFLVFAPVAFGDTIAYVSWTAINNSQVWKIDVDTSEITVLNAACPDTSMRIGISPLDNNLYGVSSGTSGGTWEINQTTGEITSVWGPKNCAAIAFASDGTLYTHSGARQKLASYDLENQTGGTFGNALPQIFPILSGFAINSQDQAIMVDNYKKFYSVNLSTGDFTDIGKPSGLTWILRGLDYDSSDQLIGCSDYGIYRIDIGSMSTTQLMSFTPPTSDWHVNGIATANVPEPATITLLITGLFAGRLLLLRRR